MAKTNTEIEENIPFIVNVDPVHKKGSKKGTELVPFVVEPVVETEEERRQVEDWRNSMVTLGEVNTPSFKDSLTMMSHPLFAFRPKKETMPRVIDCGRYVVTLSPSNHGIPTYNDADILIYAMSQIAARIKEKGNSITPDMLKYHSDIVFSVKDYFRAIKKAYGGKQQQAFLAALQRLSTTTITISAEREVNGKRVKFEQTVPGFLDTSMSMATINEQVNPMAVVRLRLADWLVRDVVSLNVLTIPVEYFDLAPFAKAVYLVARRYLGIPRVDLKFAEVGMEGHKIEEYQVPVPQVKLINGRKMDMFYWKTSLSNLSMLMGNTRLMRNFKQDLIKAIAEVDFGFFEIALTNAHRLKDTEVVFFRKHQLAANIARASLLYAGFQEFYDTLLTTEMIRQKVAANEDF